MSDGESLRIVGTNAGSEKAIRSPSPSQENSTRERYFQMWQQYSQAVSCSYPAELDFKVGRRAFEAGVSQREIALMLVAGSPTVKPMMQEQRKPQAMEYVNRVAQLSCQDVRHHAQPKATRHHQMDLGD